MSAKEYNVWVADYRIEPFGERREDLRTATIVQSNLAPHSKKEVKLKDCILNFEPPKPMKWQDMQAMCFARSAAMNRKK